MKNKLQSPTQYILDAIDTSGYGQSPSSDTEKLQFACDTFYAEYGWNVAQTNEQKALANWLAGLPSSCNIEWRNHAILELGRAWGELSEKCSDAREDYYLNHWFCNMAARIRQLWDSNGIKRPA